MLYKNYTDTYELNLKHLMYLYYSTFQLMHAYDKNIFLLHLYVKEFFSSLVKSLKFIQTLFTLFIFT